MHKIFLIFLLLSHTLAFSQDSTNQTMRIDVDVIAPVSTDQVPDIHKSSFKTYSIIIKVTNTQDTLIRMSFRACSWFDSFIIDNNSFWLIPWGCDANPVESITIDPGKSAKFYGILGTNQAEGQGNNTSRFKIGFLDFPFQQLVWPGIDKNTKPKRILWSENVLLMCKLTKFETPNTSLPK
ncbi:MAG TPA: hypothetical protein VNS32_22505 [Flavisolibacter sp.]|nr:hypothetical protein [Flavisolibacter sp.]